MAHPITEPPTVSRREPASNSAHGAPGAKQSTANTLPWAAAGCGAFLARLLISQIFILSGVMKILDPAGTAAQMEGRDMFWIPFFLWAAAAVELGGGLALLIGYKARPAALALFLFLIPVTLTFHSYWTYPAEQQQQQMIMFMHNLTLMGGLILVMTFGAGPFSIDRWGKRSS
jgi:putative oxidoreductase